ncbi:hypothetical protein AB6A40_001861 [Gnathostoma spinigerum]|uniref:Uncharacterized protein n=1 Tax=Gnathostoma spinigerum TaxID=75299 RepID=A0ABD6EEN9_9BILA
MSTLDRIPIDVKALRKTSQLDEETWLSGSANLDDSSKSSSQGEANNVDEWLKGAALTVDFQTRSALSRSLQRHAARKKKRKSEKLLLQRLSSGSSDLSEIKETILEGELNADENQTRRRCDCEPHHSSVATSTGGDIAEPPELSSNFTLMSFSDEQHLKEKKSVYEATQKDEYFEEHQKSAMISNWRHEEDNIVDGDQSVQMIMSNTLKVSTTECQSMNEESDDEFYDATSDFSDDVQTPTIHSSKHIAPPHPHLHSTPITADVETRAVEKLNPVSSSLGALVECCEKPGDVDDHQNEICEADIRIVTAGPLSSSDFTPQGVSFPKHPVTARVPPIMVREVDQPVSQLEYASELRRMSSPLSKKTPSDSPDLEDIKQIAEQQENALKEERLRLRRKSSSNSDGGRLKSPGDPSVMNTSPTQPFRITSSLVSSRSVDFSNNNNQLMASRPSGISHLSRLPTPIRRLPVCARPGVHGGFRSARFSRMGPRDFAGGSTPSINAREMRSTDSRSECGEGTPNSRKWADEIF